jgi:peptide/nickel transport system permease protein
MRAMTVLRGIPLEARWGLAILIVIVALSILVPIVSPYDPMVSAGEVRLPPSTSYLFGTDQLGRDMFTRTFAAAQLDIALALLAVAIPLIVGTTIGAIVGTTQNGLISSVWMILVDAINAFPLIVLAIGIVAMLGQGVEGVLIALVMTNWARYAKLARARTLALRQADFIYATQVLGYSPVRVLVRHVLPNVFSTTIAYALSDFVIVIVTIAGLSFLGLGVRPPIPEWGSMMSEGRLFLTIEWWITVFPGLILSLTAVGVALIAESVVGWATGEER